MPRVVLVRLGGVEQRKAEISDSYPIAIVEKDVVQYEIAVQQASTVHVVEGLADLQGDLDRPLARRTRGKALRAQRAPRQPWAHQVVLRAGLATIERGGDVRMREREERRRV